MAVVVKQGSTIAKLAFLHTHTGFPKRPETHALAQNRGFFDLQNATAFGNDRFRCLGVRFEIFAEIIRSAENAIVGARYDIGERIVIADQRAVEIFESRNDCGLPPVRFEIRVFRELTRANARAIDHKIEAHIDLFEFFDANAVSDRTPGFLKTVYEVIEINCGVSKWNAK